MGRRVAVLAATLLVALVLYVVMFRGGEVSHSVPYVPPTPSTSAVVLRL
jgi:hypothetical protein